MLFELVLGLSVYVSCVFSNDERQAGLIILPPIILGYNDLYDEPASKEAAEKLRGSEEHHIHHDHTTNTKKPKCNYNLSGKDVTFVGKIMARNKKYPCRHA